MRGRRQSGKAGASTAIVPAVLGIILALSASAGSVNGNFISALVAVCIIAGVIYAIFSIIKKAAGAGEKLNLRSGTREKNVEDLPMSSTIKSSDGAVYNENSAEELFRRDKEKRLSQLDVFLKNGIVNKEEYSILKERYEKQSYERN